MKFLITERLTVSIVFLFLFFTGTAFSLFSEEHPCHFPVLDSTQIHPSPSFVFRKGVFPVNNFDDLLDGPVKIEKKIETERIHGKKYIHAMTDYHALYRFPAENFKRIIMDYENQDKVFSRLTCTKDLTPSVPFWEPHLQEAQITYSILGYHRIYRYLLSIVSTVYPNGDLLVKWNLVHSVDHKFNRIYGSWYIHSIIYKGEQCTYLRNYSDVTFLSDIPGLKTISSLTARAEVRRYFRELKRYAEKKEE